MSGEKKEGAKATKKPAEVIIGEWVVDADATKSGWGDKAEEFSKRAIDEMEMEMKYAEDNTMFITKNGREGEGIFKIKSDTENSIVLDVSPKGMKEGDRVNSWTFNIIGPDKVIVFLKRSTGLGFYHETKRITWPPTSLIFEIERPAVMTITVPRLQ